MGYHASGKPVFRTGSVIVPPPDVRVTQRYGNGIKASGYNREDANGFSAALMRDVALRKPARKPRMRAQPEDVKPQGQGPRTRVWVDRNAQERKIVGPIRWLAEEA